MIIFIPKAFGSLVVDTATALKRNSNYDELIKLGDKRNKDALFIEYTGGIKTGRDAWTTAFSKKLVIDNMKKSIAYYNKHLGNVSVYDENTTAISWT